MKLYLLIAFIISCSILAYGQENADLKLDEVKVYISGAELTHSANLKLEQGNNHFILSNIADVIVPNSISAFVPAGVSIIAVNEKSDYLAQTSKSKEVIKLEDSLAKVNMDMLEKTNQLQTYDAAIDLLVANKNISGKDKVLTTLDLKNMLDYFSSQLLEIKNDKTHTQQDIWDLQKVRDRLQNQLNQENQRNSKPVHQIELIVDSKSKQKIELVMKYFVNNAGWVPFYDIRVKDLTSPIQFYHKANIWQSTGLNWEDVSLIISTRNPTISGEMPEVVPVYLNFLQQQPRGDYVGKNTVTTMSGGYSRAASESSVQSAPVYKQVEVNSGSFQAQNNTFSTSISVEYKTDILYNIPSDSKPHFVDLTTSEVKGISEYYTAPKYQLNAFLVSKINNWNEQNLLPGEANLYFENSFTGKTQIQPEMTEDTMMLSLGIDKNIIVTRENIKDFTETKFLSSDIERFFGYKIVIKNNKKSKIRLTIEEQIPISKNEDIKVKLIESNDAKLDAETGSLTWTVDIEPGKTIEKTYRYSVRHPSGKKVTNF